MQVTFVLSHSQATAENTQMCLHTWHPRMSSYSAACCQEGTGGSYSRGGDGGQELGDWRREEGRKGG